MADEVTQNAAPPAATPPAEVSAPPADGSAAAPPAAPESSVIRTMREQIEQTKQQLEPWQKLGATPEQAARAYKTYQTQTTEAMRLGKDLGYTDEELQPHLERDLAGTLAQLRQFAEKQRSQNEQNADQPLTRREAAELAKRESSSVVKAELDRIRAEAEMADAEYRYNGEVDRQIKAQFKDGEITDELREDVERMVERWMQGDKEAQARFKAGQVADVAKFVQQAKTRTQKIYTSLQQNERGRNGGTPPGPQAPPAPKVRDVGLKTVPGMRVGDLQALKRG